jgi:hypothetical protein
MPYKSTAQQRYFHTKAMMKSLGAKTVDEWDQATSEAPGGYGALPAHVAKREAKKEAKRRAAARALKGKM